MIVPHMFVSYETTGAAFAIQLMSDLRQAGAEVVSDSIGEQLPLCQYLIVVQTPAALQSPRVRVVVNSALQLVQTGQMSAILRVIASDLHGAKAQTVPLRWASTAEVDASQDYARAVAKLHIQLGLGETKTIPGVPPRKPGNGTFATEVTLRACSLPRGFDVLFSYRSNHMFTLPDQLRLALKATADSRVRFPALPG